MTNKKLNINQIKEKFKTDDVQKWSFYHYSAPVYIIRKGQKTYILDYRRHAYPLWITADALGVMTKNRFHAIKGMKYIVCDALKSKILATFNRPKWPTLRMWRQHFNYDWREQAAAQILFMGNLMSWFDDKARNIKKADRFKSVEDVMRFSIWKVFEGLD